MKAFTNFKIIANCYTEYVDNYIVFSGATEKSVQEAEEIADAVNPKNHNFNREKPQLRVDRVYYIEIRHLLRAYEADYRDKEIKLQLNRLPVESCDKSCSPLKDDTLESCLKNIKEGQCTEPLMRKLLHNLIPQIYTNNSR